MAHYWSKVQTELHLEEDLQPLLRDYEILTEAIKNDPEAKDIIIGQDVLDEIYQLREEKLVLSASRFHINELIRERAEELQRVTQKHKILLQLKSLGEVLAEKQLKKPKMCLLSCFRRPQILSIWLQKQVLMVQ